MTSSIPSRNAWRNEALSKIDPRHTALLVIDLQNDFCSDSGALAVLGSNVSPCKAVAERIAPFLRKVRDVLPLIAFFRLVYDPDRMSESQKERLMRDGKPIICQPGSSGVELFVSPEASDLIFTKHHYSAFTNDEFLRVLHERGIKNVVVTGVDTHICVEGTVRQGYDLGYRMLVLRDLVATRESELAQHQNSLATCERYFAISLESHLFTELLRSREMVTTR